MVLYTWKCCVTCVCVCFERSHDIGDISQSTNSNVYGSWKTKSMLRAILESGPIYLSLPHRHWAKLYADLRLCYTHSQLVQKKTHSQKHQIRQITQVDYIQEKYSYNKILFLSIFYTVITKYKVILHTYI